MNTYTVIFRTIEDNPCDEMYFASYVVNASDVDNAARKVRMLYAESYKDIQHEECDIDVEWSSDA